MVDYLIQDTTLIEIANAIREKTGRSDDDLIPVQTMAEEILNIRTGGGITDIGTEEEMNALLVSENIGNIYRFVGETTDMYVNGDIYIVEETK